MPENRPISLFSPVGRDELDRLVDRFESAWQSGLVFGLLILFLMFRPQGFFGAGMVLRRA